MLCDPLSSVRPLPDPASASGIAFGTMQYSSLTALATLVLAPALALHAAPQDERPAAEATPSTAAQESQEPAAEAKAMQAAVEMAAAQGVPAEAIASAELPPAAQDETGEDAPPTPAEEPELAVQDTLDVEPIRLDYIDDRKPKRERYQLSLIAGGRDFTDDEIFGRVDDEVVLGIEYSHEIRDGFGLEVGTLGSLSTNGGVSGDVDVTGAAAEFFGGARYTHSFDESPWHPYVGAGVTMIIAGVDNDEGGQVADDQDLSIGGYVRAGVMYDVTEVVTVGVDLRSVFGTDLELETVSGDADYNQLALVLGFRF